MEKEKCDTCKGGGLCRHCDGTGKCPECSGSGIYKRGEVMVHTHIPDNQHPAYRKICIVCGKEIRLYSGWWICSDDDCDCNFTLLSERELSVLKDRLKCGVGKPIMS